MRVKLTSWSMRLATSEIVRPLERRLSRIVGAARTVGHVGEEFLAKN